MSEATPRKTDSAPRGGSGPAPPAVEHRQQHQAHQTNGAQDRAEQQVFRSGKKAKAKPRGQQQAAGGA